MNSWKVYDILFMCAFIFCTNALPIKSVYPHRAMMLTGIYRPVRHSAGSQATGVFAQGNAVSGGAYLENQPHYLPRGPEPVDETEISSAEAEAAPEPIDLSPSVGGDDDQIYPQHNGDAYDNQSEGHVKIYPGQPNKEDELAGHSTEASIVEESDVPQSSGITARPSKIPVSTKKTQKHNIHSSSSKKTNIQIDDDQLEADDDDNDDDDDGDEIDSESPVPFVPFKANRRNNIPNLNNFFPMVFSFPKSLTRSGSSSGSPPGMITAIANSYSTGKGGVASSVATAYGGSPNGKKKHNQSYDEK